ncbi:MAG: alpha/beta hydrolase [Bacteroidota bacterium]
MSRPNPVVWHPLSLDLPQARLAGEMAGEGKRLLLCLHGYLQVKEMWRVVFSEIPEGWQILTVDLPLFGKTEWHDQRKPLDKHFLDAFWQELQDRFPDKQIYLMGFSMGGKLAMCMQLRSPKPVPHVVLIAPDGIKSNFLHRVAMFSSWGKAVFRFFLGKPNFVLGLAQRVHQIGWIDSFLLRFVRINVSTSEQRNRISAFMHMYGGLRLRFTEISRYTQKHQNRWLILWGAKDTALPASQAPYFVEQVPHSQHYILPEGHMILEDNPTGVMELLQKHFFAAESAH